MLACQPAVPHIPSGAFLSLGERTLVACTNGLSVKMDPNDVTGRAKKLEEKKEEEEGEELFRSALESARAVAWLGALLSVLSLRGGKERKKTISVPSMPPTFLSSHRRRPPPPPLPFLQSGGMVAAKRQNRPFVSLGQIGCFACLLTCLGR